MNDLILLQKIFAIILLLKIEGEKMKKFIKSTIALSLTLSVFTPLHHIHTKNLSNNYINTNGFFKKAEMFNTISVISNIHNISSSKDDDELDWYYISKGKNQIPDAPRESIDFLKENSVYYLGDTSKKVLYLTFDAGHENDNTPKILDTLKEFKVPAAFFVTKPFIDKHPDLVKRMVDEGHIVGNHSVHHKPMTQIHNKEEFALELNGVADSYKEATGMDMPKFFRPPDWKYSKNSLKMTKDLGYKTIFWSFAFKDWRKDQLSEKYVVEKILAGAHPGAIILLYAVSDTDTKVLGTAIKNLKLEGYEFKSLNDLPTE